jgi:hypothetical protein
MLRPDQPSSGRCLSHKNNIKRDRGERERERESERDRPLSTVVFLFF